MREVYNEEISPIHHAKSCAWDFISFELAMGIHIIQRPTVNRVFIIARNFVAHPGDSVPSGDEWGKITRK
jgi:hypothetical protein